MQIEFRLVRYRGRFAAEWYGEDGSRYRRSLGTDEHEEAARRLKDEFIPAFERGARPNVITVGYAWETYREHLGEKPTATTMGHEWKAIGPFFGALSADTISEADCKDYIELRQQAGRKNGTIWTELGHLRSSLCYAEAKGLIEKAPKIYRPERPPPRDLRMSRDEVSLFIDACDFFHLKVFAVLAITTAARMGALLDLTWDRVDFKLGIITLANPDRETTNKGRATVPINDTARALLLEAYQGRTCRYVIEWAGDRVSSLKKGIKGTATRAGIPWVTAHVFRHSAACFMAEAGVPMSEIAQYLGHSDSRITERIYAKYSPSYLRKAASALEFDISSNRGEGGLGSALWGL